MLRWPRASSLQTRVLLLVLLAVVLPVFLISYATWEDRRNRVAGVEGGALGFARLIAAANAELLDETRQLLAAVAETDEIQNRAPHGGRRVLGAVRARYAQYASLAVLGTDGTVLFSDPPDNRAYGFANQHWFQELMATGRPTVGEYLIGRTTHRPVLIVATPVRGPESEIRAVVGAALDLAWVNERAAKMRLPGAFVSIWLDREGTVLARFPDPEQQVGHVLRAPGVLAAIKAKAEGLVHARGADGRNWIYALSQLRDGASSELSVAVAVPEDAVLASANQILARNLAALATLGLLTLALAWFGTGWFALRPVRRLAETVRRIEGGELHAQTGLRNMKGELGELARAVDTMADTLRRREAEQESAAAILARSEDHFRRTFDQAPVGAAIVSLDQRYLRVNEALCRITGYSAAELQSMGIRDITHPDDLAGDLEEARLLQLGETDSFQRDKRYIRKDGRIAWVHLSGRLMRDASGCPLHFLPMMEDITDSKQAELKLRDREAQLRQAQKMEAIGRLAGGVAHDFNNLLTAILGYSGLVLAQVEDGSPIKDDIAEIHKAGRSAAALTRQLLAFSRKQILEPQELDLGTVVNDCERMLRRVIGEDIAIVIRIAPNLPRVVADPEQIRQIILNLAVNARDAMPEGGTLTIDCADVRQPGLQCPAGTAPGPGRYVLLTMTDTGHGMTAEVHAHLFEPFFTTKEVGKGTGLGLSTVYGIVTQSHGHIWADSEPSQGATFSICLPAVDAGADRDSLNVRGVGAHQPHNPAVLVADDSAGIRDLSRRVLEAHGYRVLLAADGNEALRLWEETRASLALVLADITMPGLNGLDLAHRIAGGGQPTEVLLMSGYSEGLVDASQPLPPGIRFLKKPFTPEVLLKHVEEALAAA